MDMDPGEGASDGRVKREPNNIDVEIKQEPNIKEEPADGSEFGWVTRLSEGFGTDATTGTLNIGLVDKFESDIDLEFDLNGVKEEVKCEGKKPDKGKDSSFDSDSKGNEANAQGDQNDEPVIEPKVSRKGLNSNAGKRRDGSRKQDRRKIPRNKAAKKRTVHKCHVCGYVTSHKSHLNAHIRSHTGDRPYKCDQCSKSFTFKCNLNQHKKVHSGEKRFECSVCFKSFAQKNNLNGHFRTHADELPHSCLKCGQRFPQKQSETAHTSKTTGEHRFQCKICGKKFIRKDRFNQHLASHRDRFPFGCIKCRLAFAMEEDKVAHENVSGRRQYQCCICKVFKLQTANLRRHMLAHHTGEKPFQLLDLDEIQKRSHRYSEGIFYILMFAN
ncbi:zinc finger protein 1-like [Sitodiplosis mosellana]|uniref:zinc finger protein 1-like n=1 Tax=Sitodiplosis mosellana TaxID=263140 RepID=UPI0024448B5A|nr:zinc finger protein 1-like [Sitodiplosis mosellana]